MHNDSGDSSSLAGQARTTDALQSYVDGFLCRAWGETDLPEARLVRSREEWEAFVVEAQWGPDTKYADLIEEDREMVDAQVRYIVVDMADNNEGSINFEIGGISVERVTFLAALAVSGATPTTGPDKASSCDPASASAQTVPGYVLVPLQMTQAMRDAADATAHMDPTGAWIYEPEAVYSAAVCAALNGVSRIAGNSVPPNEGEQR